MLETPPSILFVSLLESLWLKFKKDSGHYSGILLSLFPYLLNASTIITGLTKVKNKITYIKYTMRYKLYTWQIPKYVLLTIQV